MTENEYWLWLSSLTGVRPGAKTALLDVFGSPGAIYAASPEMLSIRGVSPSEREILSSSKNPSVATFIAAQCRVQGIRAITLDSEEYPARLKEVYDPPVVLYVKGTLPDIDSLAAVAVIGTRSATSYGLRMAATVSSQICACGGAVISGLTAGIDSAAARGALECGGICIGVLGTAHEAASGELPKQVTRGGAIISEYPPGTKSDRHFFRARNRIAAGLSVGVAVIEAPEKSGTRFFVNDALELGKDIFVLPGNADSPNSVGLYSMLREGASPFLTGADIMREYIPLFPDSVRIPEDTDRKPPRGNSRKEKHPAPGPDLSDVSAPVNAARPAAPERKSSPRPEQPSAAKPALSAAQLAICNAIGDRAMCADEISVETGISVSALLSQLTLLEIKGILCRVNSTAYALKKGV